MIKMRRIVTLLMLGALCLTGAAQAQTDTYTASGTWTAPAGVTTVTVEVWGGGGAGGGNSTNQRRCWWRRRRGVFEDHYYSSHPRKYLHGYRRRRRHRRCTG